MFDEIVIFGKTIELYNLMYVVGVVGMLLICLFTGKKYRFSKPKALIYTLATFACGVLGAKLMGKIYSFSLEKASGGEYIPSSGVCIFGALLFLPVFMIVVSFISRESYRALMDYMTPGIFFILCCAKFGCSLEGCCHGIADPNGIFNHRLDYRVFPVQLYESLCTLAVVVILLVIISKRGKIRYGSIYPIGSLLYCGARFIWENFRYYEHEIEKEFFIGLTYWQMWVIIITIISVVWLIILHKSNRFTELNIEKVSYRRDYKAMIAKMEADRRRKEKEKLKAKKAEKKNKSK